MNLKTYQQIPIQHNFVILFTIITTCFGLRDHHHTIIMKILKIGYNAVLIKPVIWDPI